jgi:hypothetical protein
MSGLGKVRFKLLLLAVMLSTACNSPSQLPLPGGWHVAGASPKDYRVSVVLDRDGEHVSIANGRFFTHGFGTATYITPAVPYRGKRIQLSAALSTVDVKKTAGMWMRVDGKNHVLLAFDNMLHRSLHGSTPPKLTQVTLDVPPQAELIAYGLMLNGRGTAQARQLRLREVGGDVPSTDVRAVMNQPAKGCGCKLDNKLSTK